MQTTNKQQSKFFPFFKGISLILLLALSISFTSCEEEEVKEVSMELGDTAPAFSLTSSTGAKTMLSDFSNKVVVLFFLGNNCPSCKAAAPNVESILVTPFAKRTDYMVIGLDQWDGNAASVEAFKNSTGLSVPVLLNASAVAKAYGTTFDRIVVIDKMGKIMFVGKQGASSDIEAVKKKVESLLGIVEVPVGDAPAFTLNSTSGSPISLSDYSNRVRVLFFFGNNCPPCKAAAPSIESMLVTPFASRTDYVVLGLDQWNGNLASVNSFRSSTNVTFPLLLNAAAVATSYGTTYDRILVVDKAGNIVFKGTQGVASDLAAVKTKVNTLLGL